LVEGKQVVVRGLQSITDRMKGSCAGTLSGWNITFPSAKIGCSTFTLAELEQIVSTYNELNK